MSVMLDINSGKVWYCLAVTLWKCRVLFDVSSGKVCSIVCQYLFENVSITWCLEECAVLFGSNSLKVPLMSDITLKMCLLLFCSNSLKVWVLLDMNSENVFTLYKLMFCFYFLTIRMVLNNNNFVYIWFSWSFSHNLN